MRGVRNVSGVAADVKGVLTVPKAAKPAAQDSTKRRTPSDSLKLGPDTLGRRLPKKRP